MGAAAVITTIMEEATIPRRMVAVAPHQELVATPTTRTACDGEMTIPVCPAMPWQHRSSGLGGHARRWWALDGRRVSRTRRAARWLCVSALSKRVSTVVVWCVERYFGGGGGRCSRLGNLIAPGRSVCRRPGGTPMRHLFLSSSPSTSSRPPSGLGHVNHAPAT